jgi:hypothetical protein
MGAAVAVPAFAAGPAAAATSGGGTSYNSVATAMSGRVIVGGQQVPVPNAIITAKTGDSPKAAALGAGQAESALSGVPALGQDVIDSMKTANDSGTNVVIEKTVASADGTSSACAGFLSGDCDATGSSVPVQLNLGAADLLTPDVVSQLPEPVKSIVIGLEKTLNTYDIVLIVSGPRATCTAGPSGGDGSSFTATQNLATAAVDVRQNGKSVIPGGPISLRSGDVLSQVPASKLTGPLSTILGVLPNGLLNLTITPGYTAESGKGPQTTGTAGELGLTAEGTRLLYLKGAQAVCGPNEMAAATAPAPSPSSTAPAGAGSSGSSSPEEPLGGGIQTDEGRSGSNNTPLWLSAAGGGVALTGAAGGTILWRRRLQGGL